MKSTKYPYIPLALFLLLKMVDLGLCAANKTTWPFIYGGHNNFAPKFTHAELEK
jgi:hypothetical protein